jgi:serine/threonine-protein kinase HipA
VEDPGEETAELLRQVVVNVVLGNVDAHAKNYTLLYRKLGVPEVSPLYDVVPVVDVEPRARHLSMRIAGEVLLEDVDRSSILEEARGWGMEAGRAESVLDDTLVRLREGIARMRDCFPEAAIRHERGAVARAARLGA